MGLAKEFVTNIWRTFHNTKNLTMDLIQSLSYPSKCILSIINPLPSINAALRHQQVTIGELNWMSYQMVVIQSLNQYPVTSIILQ